MRSSASEYRTGRITGSACALMASLPSECDASPTKHSSRDSSVSESMVSRVDTSDAVSKGLKSSYSDPVAAPLEESDSALAIDGLRVRALLQAVMSTSSHLELSEVLRSIAADGG